MNDCAKQDFVEIYDEMKSIALSCQPGWFRPLLLRSRYLQGARGFNHWSRAWEYPWAIKAADLSEHSSVCTLDVGGGGSPFSIYLSRMGNDSYVADPSLELGRELTVTKDKKHCGSPKSFILNMMVKVTGIHKLWGQPVDSLGSKVRYVSSAAEKLNFANGYFDRVFCLSVMEHIPEEIWGRCMSEFERVLKPGGRLIITMDMNSSMADDRGYLKLVNSTSLKLIGDPSYDFPISSESKKRRHPGYSYETIGLVWQK
jgi:SAM-dependent methyltransferase